MRYISEQLRACAVAVVTLCLTGFGALVIGASPAAADSSDWLTRAFLKSAPASRSNLGGSSGSSGARKSKGVQVASLGSYTPPSSYGGSLSGGSKINWVASSGCLNSSLRGTIAAVAAQYGSVTVSSTCRSHAHNARVGGAPKSLHLTGDAADFRVHGNWGAAMAYLQSTHGGGFKHYGGGLFHIDTGPRRPM